MIDGMLVQELRDTCEEQLFAGSRQGDIELAVDQVSIVFGEVAELL